MFEGQLPNGKVFQVFQPQRRTICVQLWEYQGDYHPRGKLLEIGEYFLWFPKLIFITHEDRLRVGRGRQLFVGVVKDDVIEESTSIYFLPLPNIYRRLAICLGNGPLLSTERKIFFGELIAYFWQSSFYIHHQAVSFWRGEEYLKELFPAKTKLESFGLWAKTSPKDIEEKIFSTKPILLSNIGE